MVIVIHGDDIVSSRNYFYEQKQKLENPILIDGEKLLFNEIFQLTQGNNIFNKVPTVLIENFFTKNKSADFKKIVSFINIGNLNIIFWEGSEISKSTLASIKSEVKTYSVPKTLFLFLDNFIANNENLTKTFQELRKSMADELIFFMLIRQFRLMISLSSDAKIDEVVRLAPWQRSKLQRQASYFKNESLVKVYKNLFEIDLNIKTGKLPFSYENSIDFLIAGL